VKENYIILKFELTNFEFMCWNLSYQILNLYAFLLSFWHGMNTQEIEDEHTHISHQATHIGPSFSTTFKNL
jgi:hypothetical protein